MNTRNRLRQQARRSAARKRKIEQAPLQVNALNRSATTFYNDVLDWWAGL